MKNPATDCSARHAAGAGAVTSFGHLPRTRIRVGAPGSWSGRNSLFGGIEVFRVPNIAGVWAQEFWEWRLHALNALLCVTIIGIPLAIWNDRRNAAPREIYSHAITLEAALMLGLPCSEDEMVGSLATYSYCRSISRDGLLMLLRAARPKARSWCGANRAKIGRVAAIAASGGS